MNNDHLPISQNEDLENDGIPDGARSLLTPLLRRATLSGALHLGVALSLGATCFHPEEGDDDFAILGFLLCLLIAALQLLLRGHEVPTALSHMVLILLSTYLGSSGALRVPFAIAGVAVGGEYLFAAFCVTIWELKRQPSSEKSLARAVMLVHVILLPLQLVALASVAIAGDCGDVPGCWERRLEGGLFSLWGAASGWACYLQARRSSFYENDPGYTSGIMSRIMAVEFLVVALAGGSRTIALSEFIGGGLFGAPRQLYVVWLMNYACSASLVCMLAFVVCVVCCLGREEFPVLFRLCGGHFDDQRAAHENLSSSPASLLLVPFIWHFVVSALPLVTILGLSIFFRADEGRPQIIFAVAELAQGIVICVLAVASSVAESIRTEFLSAIFLTNLVVSLAAFAARAILAPCLLQAAPQSALSDFHFATMLVFWVIYTLSLFWTLVSMASDMNGNLWEKVSRGYFLRSFYHHQDAIQAGEAVFGSLAPSLALTFAVLPLESSAMVLCGRQFRENRCPLSILCVVTFAYGCLLLWVLSSGPISVLTRLQGPPCFSFLDRHIFLLNITQHVAEATTFLVLMLEVGFVCAGSWSGGCAKALILTAAVLRFGMAPLIALITFSTREEREGSYVNALGTLALLCMQNNEGVVAQRPDYGTASRAAATEGKNATPPEDLVCSITGDVFLDPVVASDGATYERHAILKWIGEKKKDVEAAKRELRDTNNESERAKRVVEAGIKSPLGIGQLSRVLIGNRDMKRRAAQWREENG